MSYEEIKSEVMSLPYIERCLIHKDLSASIRSSVKAVTMDHYQKRADELTSAYCKILPIEGVTPRALLSGSRQEELVWGRWMVQKVLMEKYGVGVTEAARLTLRSWAAVKYGKERMDDLLANPSINPMMHAVWRLYKKEVSYGV